MGLLDFAMYDDPASVGRLAFGAGLLNAAGPSKMPISFGQALASGLMGAQQASSEAATNQRRNLLVDLQMKKYLDDMAEAQSTKEQQARSQAEREAFLSGLPSRLNMPLPGGPTVANAAAQGRVSPAMLAEAFRLGIKPEDLRALAGQTKVARTVDTEGPGGKTVQQLDDYGQPVGAGLPGYVAPVQVNQGDKVTFAKPTAGLSLPIGMSPEGRDASARGWATVNIARDNARREDGGQKPPPGYRWKTDGTLEAIPGGPADIKATAEGQKAEARRQLAGNSANMVLDTVREAKGLVGITTAGAGGYMASLPATDARALQGKLLTIKANLGFDRLQAMREASPTGGALGQVAVQELASLQATVASLDQLQSPTDLNAALDKIETHYNNWLRTIDPDRRGGGGSEFAAPPKVRRYNPATGKIE